jgi:carotenoid cleavage dioxygenase-like enzyme
LSGGPPPQLEEDSTMNPQAVAAAAGTRRLGFENLDEEVKVDRLEAQGEIPEWLAGDLVRVTPAMLDDRDRRPLQP